MHKHGFNGRRGQVHDLIIDSKVLKNNPWNDSHQRLITVYTPPDYHKSSSEPYPLLIDLVGYLGGGPQHSSFKTLSENVPERCDRLFSEEKLGQGAVIAFPNCFTHLGGNQYINSPSVGNYADFIINEVVPLVESEFHAGKTREKRGVFGKSSGGYGSIIYGMKYSSTFSAIASHSGDMYFDFIYRPDFANLLNQLATQDYDVLKFIDRYWDEPKPSYQKGMALMMICMAATYDGNENNPIEINLPFKDLKSGVVDEVRWQQWLKHDPIHLVSDYAESLKSLNLLFFDVGNKDQYRIHYGARQLSNKLKEHKIEHIYEEFDDDHSGIDYRMDRSLPLLIDALS